MAKINKQRAAQTANFLDKKLFFLLLLHYLEVKVVIKLLKLKLYKNTFTNKFKVAFTKILTRKR